MCDNKNKIQVQDSYYLSGIDKSVIDFDLVSSVQVGVTILTESMYKSKGITYIGLKQPVSNKEKIQIGNLNIIYNVYGKAKGILIKEGYIYKVKRVDGFNITQLDIDNAKKGTKVRIKNRKSFKQLMNYELFDSKK